MCVHKTVVTKQVEFDSFNVNINLTKVLVDDDSGARLVGFKPLYIHRWSSIQMNVNVYVNSVN